MEAKHNLKILLLLWMVQPSIVNALMVLKSLEPLDKPDPFPGMKLRRKSIVNVSEFSKGITFCGRFNFRRFSPVMLEVGSFIKISRGKVYEDFFLGIGGVGFGIKNVQNEKNQLWITNQWQNFCLAFSVDTFHVSLIKVSTFLVIGLANCLHFSSGNWCTQTRSYNIKI